MNDMLDFFTSLYKNQYPNATDEQIIAELEKNGVEVKNFPVIMFTNRIAPYGFGFYNDYDQNAELKNNKSYDFIQDLSNIATVGETVEEIPSF